MSDDQEAQWYEDCLFEAKYARTLAEAARNFELWCAVFEEEGGISFESRPYDHEREHESDV